MLRLRRFVTSTVAFSFVVVGITGVVFKLWFKTSTLEEIHGWVGLWLVAAASLHIVQNWRSLTKHLRDPRVYALLVPIVAVIATSTLQKEPPRGPGPRAVMNKLLGAPAGDVAHVLGKQIDVVCAAMKRDGLQVCAADQTVAQLADRNHEQPERVLGYFAL